MQTSFLIKLMILSHDILQVLVLPYWYIPGKSE